MFLKRIVAILSAWILFVPACCLSDAVPEPTATPEPVQISSFPGDPPDVILRMTEIALEEWEKVGGKALPKSNKYTKWVNDAEWGWCAGFTSWCALEAGVPQESLARILEMPEGESDPVFSCSAVSPGKLLRAFQHMHRTTMIPRKGFFVVYGDRTNYSTHVGLVCDAEPLGNGKYRLTTVEGNMKSTVRMYIADYEPEDVYYGQHHKPSVSNLSAVPEDERDGENTRSRTYHIRVSDVDGSDWYVTCFLMTWIPGSEDAEAGEMKEVPVP